MRGPNKIFCPFILQNGPNFFFGPLISENSIVTPPLVRTNDTKTFRFNILAQENYNNIFQLLILKFYPQLIIS